MKRRRTSRNSTNCSTSRTLRKRFGTIFTARNSLLSASRSRQTIPNAPDPSSFSLVHLVLTATLRCRDWRSDRCVVCSTESPSKMVWNLYRASVVDICESIVGKIAEDWIAGVERIVTPQQRQAKSATLYCQAAARQVIHFFHGLVFNTINHARCGGKFAFRYTMHSLNMKVQ